MQEGVLRFVGDGRAVRVAAVHGVMTVVIGDLAAGSAPGAAGLGAHRPAEPAGRLGRIGGVSPVLQQPDPDGLFQIGRVHSGARSLRGRFGGEQRAQFVQQVHAGRDEWAWPGGFPTGPGPLVREATLSG